MKLRDRSGVRRLWVIGLLALVGALVGPLSGALAGCGQSESLPERDRALPSFRLGDARVRVLLRLEGRRRGRSLGPEGYRPAEERRWLRVELSLVRSGEPIPLWDGRESAREASIPQDREGALRALREARLERCSAEGVAALWLTLPGARGPRAAPIGALYVRAEQAALFVAPEAPSPSSSGAGCEERLRAAPPMGERLEREAAAGRRSALTALARAGSSESALRLALRSRRAPEPALRRWLRERVVLGAEAEPDLEAELFELLAPGQQPGQPPLAQRAFAEELLAYAPTPSRRRAFGERSLFQCAHEPLCEEWRARLAGRVVEEQQDPPLCDAAHRVAAVLLGAEGLPRAKVARWLLASSACCGDPSIVREAMRRGLARPSLSEEEGRSRAVLAACAEGRPLERCPSLPRVAARYLSGACEPEPERP